MREWKEFLDDESGSAIVEVVLLIVVIIAVVLLFKSKITKLVGDIFNTIDSRAGTV